MIVDKQEHYDHSFIAWMNACVVTSPLLSRTAVLQWDSSLTPDRKLLETRSASCKSVMSWWSAGVCFTRSWRQNLRSAKNKPMCLNYILLDRQHWLHFVIYILLLLQVIIIIFYLFILFIYFYLFYLYNTFKILSGNLCQKCNFCVIKTTSNIKLIMLPYMQH